MITPYLSQQPIDDFGLPEPSLKFSATLSATTNTQLTVPGDTRAYKVVIRVENGGEVWFSVGDDAAAPAGASFAATSSELITGDEKTSRQLRAGQVRNFFSTGTPSISVVFFGIGPNVAGYNG